MALTYIGGELAQFMLSLPAAAIQAFQGMLLFFLARGRPVDQLPHPGGPDGGGVVNITLLLAALIVASTPILLAALGELVVEKAGVLNLGVEGMMITGAICGFAVAVETQNPVLGFIGAAAGGAALSLIFAFLTQILLSNQVATGAGTDAVRAWAFGGFWARAIPAFSRRRRRKLDLPVLSDLAVPRDRSLFP